MYDGSAGGVQGWRVVVVFRDEDATPKESFVYHASGTAGRGLASCIDRVILRERDANGGAEADAADDALFDESYAANVGLSGKGRVSSAGVGVGVGNRKGYAGYEHDESLTMYHVRHRVYRADLGRWMTRDPLGYVDGMSLYEYVGGMALVGRDPSGLLALCACLWIPGVTGGYLTVDCSCAGVLPIWVIPENVIIPDLPAQHAIVNTTQMDLSSEELFTRWEPERVSQCLVSVVLTASQRAAISLRNH